MGSGVFFFFERFIAKKLYIACWRTNNRIVPVKILNKYLYSGKKSERKVNIINSSENSKKKNIATVGVLITAECALVVYVCIALRSART